MNESDFNINFYFNIFLKVFYFFKLEYLLINNPLWTQDLSYSCIYPNAT